jgi:uncharacterized cupin superfamily protein
MEKITIDEVPELETNPAESRRRPLGDALGTTDVSVNHYELAPGESLSGGLHAHHDQEEIFLVLEGELAFDVGPDRERVDVGAGEAIRFAPGDYQEGKNESEERAVALALGAPPGTEDIDSYIHCRPCDAETIHTFDVEGTEAVHTCRECGNELRYGL